MTVKRTRIAYLLTATIALGSPVSSSALAQTRTCARIADQFDRETRTFVDEANRQNLGFLRGEALTGASGSLKTLMAGSPAASTALDLKEKWDEVQAARDKIQTTAQVMREIKACLNTAGCNPMDIANRVAADVRAWAEATLRANASAASGRVEQARGLLQNYADRSLNLSLGTMKSMAECTTQFTEQAQAASQAPPVTAPPAAKGGGGRGIAAIVGSVAAIAAGAYAYSEYQAAEDILDGFSTTPTSSSPTPTPTTGASAFNGTYRAQVTRTCVAGAFPASCSQASENATCSPTNFTFTVSNGAIRDCGSYFGNGVVQSNGDYSGLYLGSANGVPISGSFTSNGGTLTGATTSGGSSYTVRIQITKQ